MSTARITFTDTPDTPDSPVAMTVEYVGLWDADSLAHRHVAELAMAIGEPVGDPVIAAADKADAGPKLILAA